MKKLYFFCAVLFSAAAIGAQTPAPSASPEVSANTMNVTIESVQRSNNAQKLPATVTVVEGKSNPIKLRVPATARIIDSKGNPVTFDRLRKGITATVTIAGTTTDPQVVTLKIQS